jgi:hypothetical protein
MISANHYYVFITAGSISTKYDYFVVIVNKFGCVCGLRPLCNGIISTLVSASGSGQSSSSGSDYMIPASNSVERSVSAQADPDDADEEELSPYPMFEGTLNELCEAIQNYNGEEGGDETYADCDNSDEAGLITPAAMISNLL